MAVVSVLSAKGSPGATTLAVALSLAWGHRHPTGRTVLVDADPVGGDIAAGVLRGSAPAGSGMLSLAAGRGLPAGELLAAGCVPLTADGVVQAVPGVPDSQRAGALLPAWSVIESARSDRDDLDLVVDAGRLDGSPSTWPWLVASDVTLLVVRPGLATVTSARRLVETWAATSGTAAVPLRLVVVDSPSPYAPRDVAGTLGLPLAATIPFEPEHAATYSEGAPAGRGLARSRFVRAVDGLAERLAAESAPLRAGEQARPADDREGVGRVGAGGRR